MSTSSCPACSKQVTIPTGVGTTAKVRCPLCHSQYTLADALVNMPPLLELVEEGPAEWRDLSEPSGEHEESRTPDATLDYLPESMSEGNLGDADQAGGPATAGFNLVGDIEPEEFSSEEKDTEIEELGFISPEPLVRAAPADDDPLEMAGADEGSVLDFEAQPENFADAAGAGDNAGDAEEIALDFGEAAPLEDVEEVVAFEAEAPGETIEGEELVFDMIEPQATELPTEALADFDENVSATHDAGEDIELDFGEPLAAESAAAPLDAPEAAEEEEPDDDPKAKKKKKKKEKKPREPKAPAEPGQRRSLGTLVGVVTAALFAVVLSLYGVLWINPDYDFFKLGSVLPKAVLPSAMGKPKYVAAKPALPIQQPPQQQPAADAAVPSADTPPPVETPAEVPAADPNNSAPPAAPAANEPAEPAPDAPPLLEPATDNPPAAGQPETTPEKMPEKPAPAPADEPANGLPAPAPEKPAAPAPPEEPPNPLDDAKPDTLPSEPESTEGLGPVNAAAFTLADLSKAMAAAQAADQQILAAQGASDESQLKKARSNFYLSLFRLAEAATFVKDDAQQLEGLRPQFEQIVERLAADPKRIDALKFNAARWLDYSKRTTSGIVLAGNVVSARRVGKLHEIKLGIGLESDEPIVTVLAAKDPGLSPGDRAFVLGGIVENPIEQLAGYQGNDAAVVWGGQFVTATR